MSNPLKARAIAFYLPQFHPIPENDNWWGTGFTEWTNVAKAKPLFKGHYQPHLPADLGFYDLRVPEVRLAQAELAKAHGVEGFCYWHYWFGNGKRLLERPFHEVLTSGKPDFPFCLGWANETWSGIWHGAPDKILIEQTYPGPKDYEDHFNAVLPAFRDKRYITIDGRQVFVVYKPGNIPDPNEFVRIWNGLSKEAGLKGFHFVGVGQNWVPHNHGFDSVVSSAPGSLARCLRKNLLHRKIDQYLDKLFNESWDSLKTKYLGRPFVRSYEQYVNEVNTNELPNYEIPVVVSNWDNTARSGRNGLVLHNSRPDLFRILLRKALKQIQMRPLDSRVVFLKSWNEWAEGNYLEPGRTFGTSYLQVIKEELTGLDNNRKQPNQEKT
jgi:Glycosyltransferase WbsX